MSDDEKKNTQILIRVTPSEKKKIQEKAEQARMTVSSYIIALSENKKITVAENIPQLLLEITRIGTNINQIAHTGNSQKFVYREQLEEVIRLLNDVKTDMQKILSEIYNQDEHTLKDIERKIDLLDEHTLKSIERKIDLIVERTENKNGSL